MNTDVLTSIDQEIDELIHDHKEYGFNDLKQKVETILKKFDLFLIDGKLETKAIDLYLKNVITQRNHLQKQKEQAKIKPSDKEIKYALIESICQKMSFESKEELIKKVELLESTPTTELEKINDSL